ncbi:MAG: ubiquinol-cytochrome c reductase iron-sulfur subunit [Bythopirellula sp.]
MADKKKMSVADILAAARKTDGAGAADDEPAAAAPAEAASSAEAEAAPVESAAAGEKPKPAKSASGGRPSVAEMLAMARDEKGGGEKKPAAKAAKKPAAAKPAAAKPAGEKKPAAAKGAPAEPRDTASILAAARKANKSGPMSKAEAAAKEKADPRAKPKIVVPPMPEKPAYAKPAIAAKQGAAKQAKSAPDEERRTFMAAGFWLVGIVTALWTLASLKFMFPNVRREPPSKFKVGFPDGYPAGQVQTKFKAQYGVWVANAEYSGQQQIYALKSVCTHLGCTPSWLDAEQKFKCPCHGSGFYKDGINFEGPAPRPLERCAIRIADDGQIEIDKSRTFQEEMGQWEDPACYISV